ncbi:MAG: dihydroneopterin aldolase [Ramlibacter sp.]|nr:dihydroneopterin aldolase [Ramlibacter sp.]
MKDVEWLRTHCRRMFLRGLRVQAWIGVHDFEKLGPQHVIIDVDLYVSLARTSPKMDALEEVVDYDFVRKAVYDRLAVGPIQLQETLCDDVLKRLLENPRVLAVRVRTSKPDVYEDCEEVGVEVFHIRENL